MKSYTGFMILVLPHNNTNTVPHCSQTCNWYNFSKFEGEGAKDVDKSSYVLVQ